MEEKTPFEIEKKFLIKMPEEAALLSLPGSFCDEITQTYLLSKSGLTHRVRRRACQSRIVYTETEKIRISDLRCIEKEREIDEGEYFSLLEKADPNCRPIEKRRYCIPYDGRLLEVDIYPFWKKTAVLEIELPEEGAPYTLPPFLHILKEVSGEAAYKNRMLAEHIPEEPSL